MTNEAVPAILNKEHRSQLELILIGVALADPKQRQRLVALGDSSLSGSALGILKAIAETDRDAVLSFFQSRGVVAGRGVDVIDGIMARLKEGGRRDRVVKLLKEREFSMERGDLAQIREHLMTVLKAIDEE